MTTLLLSSNTTADNQQLWRAAIARGWDVERVHGPRLPVHLPPGPYVLYHDGLFAPLAAQQVGLRLRTPAADWLSRLPGRYAQRWIESTTLGEAKTGEFPCFIKSPNDKTVPATVYSNALDLPSDMPDETQVLVAEPVRWLLEFRCFVRQRRIEALSGYLRDGVFLGPEGFAASREEHDAALEFANRLLGDPDVPFPEAVVLDVGLIEQRGWAAVELNPACSSGIYGCDADRVLTVLEAACVSGSGEPC
jgi:ATP-grasp domain, R2K clade family 2